MTKVLKERAIDVRMAGARMDKLWREAPQSLNLTVMITQNFTSSSEIGYKTSVGKIHITIQKKLDSLSLPATSRISLPTNRFQICA
jgi:hypothetical protein